MTAWVYSIVRNEALLMPFWLRHYATFCDRIIVYDDHSDDGTREIVKAAGAEFRDYPGRGLDDIAFVRLASQQYREARGQADWAIWVDGDEFLYHPRLTERLDELKAEGVTLPKIEGWNMLGTEPPTGEGQIYDEIKHGFPHARYAKPCIINPALDVRWTVGRHEISVQGESKTNGDDPLRLLHFRYLGREYHELRNAKNYEQITEENKLHKHGYETAPGWDGEYSAGWYERQRPNAQLCV